MHYLIGWFQISKIQTLFDWLVLHKFLKSSLSKGIDKGTILSTRKYWAALSKNLCTDGFGRPEKLSPLEYYQRHTETEQGKNVQGRDNTGRNSQLIHLRISFSGMFLKKGAFRVNVVLRSVPGLHLRQKPSCLKELPLC